MFDENSKIDKNFKIDSCGLTKIAMQYKGPSDDSSLFNGRSTRDCIYI